ncbi:hypothetical protein ABPG77_005570 [Micractinium sp. CCAP 211/92]
MSEVAEHSWTHGFGGAGHAGREPPPADGEGPEFSMTDVAQRSGGTDVGAAGSPPVAGLPPQDGHYHFDDKARPLEELGRWQEGRGGTEDGDLVDQSWESLEDPDALLRPGPSPKAPPHMPMFRGEVDESEGFKEPGQDIASALPGRWGDNEDFTFGAYRNPDEQEEGK